MKKSLVSVLAIFAFAIVFTSCTKEGQYMPSKKIKEIVYTDYYRTAAGLDISTTEREVWTWNGKLLSYIDYYDANGDREGTSLFRYDDQNRIDEINYGTYSAKYDYDNGLIDEIEVFNANGTVRGKYEFEHKGNKITAIEMVTGTGKSMASLPFNPLRFILPESAAEKVMECAASKGTIRVTLTWSGNNVSVLEGDGMFSFTEKYQFDNKTNPFRGLLNMGENFDYSIFSQNNIVHLESIINGVTEETDYGYEYDGKYPVKMEWETTGYSPMEMFEYTVKHVTEFKYQ